MTNPDTAPFTIGYVVSAVGFTALLVLGPFAVIAARKEWRRFLDWCQRQWPDPGFDDDWRVEPSNVRVLPSQRVSR